MPELLPMLLMDVSRMLKRHCINALQSTTTRFLVNYLRLICILMILTVSNLDGVALVLIGWSR